MPQMDFRLALDLGTTSIGWCVMRLDRDKRPVAVVKTGVRIFSDGRHPKTNASLAVARREARQARRRRDRVLKRKKRVTDILIDGGFFPSDQIKRRELTSLCPYKLRKEGLDRKLTPREFARAIFHLNQRRGFKSNRKTDGRDTEATVMKSAISDLERELTESGARTLGEWLARRHQNGQSVRARLRNPKGGEKRYDFYANRKMVLEEFDRLWSCQESYNPQLYTERKRAALRDAISFQRPLRQVSPGKCTLIPTEPRAPTALPSVQRFRLFQEVNNLRIIEPTTGESIPIELAERDAIVAYLEKGKNAGFKSVIRKICDTSPSQTFNLQSEKRPSLKGNTVSKILGDKKAFGDQWHALHLAEQDSIVELLLDEENESLLTEQLQQQWGVDKDKAKYIASVSLPEGYGRLSAEAISRVLPHLESEVVTYDRAVASAGFESHSQLTEGELHGVVESSLPYYGKALQRHVAFGSGDPGDPDEVRYGRIANPTVHIALNQVRLVVNEIIKRYGSPTEVIIEVTRDLKLSEKRKKEIEKRQSDNQRRNDALLAEACECLGLDPDVIDRSKRRDLVQKMILWHELDEKNIANRCCTFSGRSIGIATLLSEAVEIEHILPYSRTLDDSLNNKTVAFRDANRIKGNRSPFEAFGEDFEHGYVYREILQRAANLPAAKAFRFAPDGYERWLRDHSDFLARALNDTAYISRLSRAYLSVVCHYTNVRVIPGALTGLMRAKLGLNQVLRSGERKNRNDHRHHAVDACVIAITDRGMLQRLATAAGRGAERGRLVSELRPPWPNFYESVARSVNSIRVSHKPDHGYQRKFMEDRAYYPISPGKGRIRVEVEGEDRTKKVIKTVRLIEIADGSGSTRHGLKENGDPRPYKGYVGGANYCIEIVLTENGKWRGEVVSSYEANQVVRRFGLAAGWKRLRDASMGLSGKPLVMRLMQDDTVEVKTDGGERVIWRLQKVSQKGEMNFAPIHEANTSARASDKSDPFKLISKRAEPLRKADARQVFVSPTGQVRRLRGASHGNKNS
ncbi:MAG: type II CRISPR RNA-guided endonuclease Cas9 [Pseudomonadota bacterium]